MTMFLDWTDSAIEDYDECISYLETNFSEKEVFRFIEKMDFSLELISKNPKTFPLSEYKDIRYLVVMPPITIFYILPDENTIRIVRIWNNRKDKKSI